MFDLQTAHDLLQKLRHDLGALKRKPASTYRAFNFFVTAEHMKDWLYPGNANRAARQRLESDSELLQVCSDLANGAKHFVVENPRPRSVVDTGRVGSYWSPGYFAARYWARGYWGAATLVVDLDGEAALALGSRISAVDLAARIVGFWENRVTAPGP